jgi:hypothetical protein
MQWPDFSSLHNNPRISMDYTAMSSLPFYQVSGFSGTLTDWEQQNIVHLTNIKGPVIIDNDAFLLKYFPIATLMGSFLWSEVIENPEHNAFTTTEIQCLKEIHPRMLGLADMVMPGVHTQTAFTGLPWFCNQPPDPEKLTNKHPGILVTGGGSEEEQLQLLNTSDAFMEKGFMVFSDAAMHLKSRGRFELFSYSSQDFLNLSAVLCRPGIGILTDCVQYKTPVIAVFDAHHPEMAHNAARIEALGIGRSLSDLKTEADIDDLIDGLLHSKGSFQEAFNNLQYNGDEMAACWILENVVYA